MPRHETPTQVWLASQKSELYRAPHGYSEPNHPRIPIKISESKTYKNPNIAKRARNIINSEIAFHFEQEKICQ